MTAAYHFANTGGWADEDYECGNCRKMHYYVNRNCNLHFPDLVNIEDVDRHWVPVYRYKTTVNGNVVDKPYQVRAGMLTECPKSILVRDKGWAIEIANQYFRAQRSLKTLGEMIGGPNASEWPAWTEDVMIVIEKQKSEVESARDIDAARS